MPGLCGDPRGAHLGRHIEQHFQHLGALRAAAADAYGVADPDRIVAAPGTQILIETLPRLVTRARVAVVGPTYAEHAAAWARAGHAVVTVPGLGAARDTDVVVVVNPNNPDGRTWEAGTLRALANAGRMLDGSPALARIRMIEAAPPGATIVLSDTGR